MTKEFEDLKQEGKPGILFRVSKVLVIVALLLVALLFLFMVFFLFMVLFPKGLWVDFFQNI